MKRKIKIEFHVHTNYSYDSATSFQDLIDRCIQKRIDVLVITDHNQIEGALRLQSIAPFRVIVGEEVLTQEGEIIGLFLKKHIVSGFSMTDTIKEIKRQGGIVYLPHPFDTTSRKTAIHKSSLIKNINDIDIIEVFNGRTIKPWDNLRAEKFANQIKKIRCIGSDAHTKYEIGRNFVIMEDFAGTDEFLRNLSQATMHRALVIPWVFLLTKYHRFIKRRFPQTESTIHICDLCGSIRSKLVYKKRGVAQKSYFISDNSYGDHLQIVQCLDCNLVYCSPRVENEKLTERYSAFKDPNYEQERLARKKTHSRLFTKIQAEYPRPGKLLDVGCATGTFLEVVKTNGWTGVGLEPSAWASRLGRSKYGLNIIKGAIEAVKLPANQFDVVTCLDVIEHVASPKTLLKTIHRVLRKDGLLCLVTPDLGSLMSQLLGENWWHIRPDHIYYFTKETLRLLLEAQGFKIEKIDKYSWTFSLNYWISRLQNKVPGLYKILGFFRNNQFLTINFWDSLEVYARKV